MLGFMLGVLGSGVFWIGYFIVSFVVGSATLKQFAPNTFLLLTTGKDKDYNSYYDIEDIIFRVVLALCHMLFWPLIVAAVVLWFILRITFGKIVFPLFCKSIQKSASILPTIKIEKQ